MSRTLDQIMSDVDSVIEARIGQDCQKTASVITEDDDIFKLAERVISSGRTEEKTAARSDEGVQFNLTEKIAHAAAIMDVYLNLPTLTKIDALEKQAQAAGYSDEQIEAYIEKNASAFKMVSVLDLRA